MDIIIMMCYNSSLIGNFIITNKFTSLWIFLKTNQISRINPSLEKAKEHNDVIIIWQGIKSRIIVKYRRHLLNRSVREQALEKYDIILSDRLHWVRRSLGDCLQRRDISLAVYWFLQYSPDIWINSSLAFDVIFDSKIRAGRVWK